MTWSFRFGSMNERVTTVDPKFHDRSEPERAQGELDREVRHTKDILDPGQFTYVLAQDFVPRQTEYATFPS